MINMPLYQCHKQVHALQIKEIKQTTQVKPKGEPYQEIVIIKFENDKILIFIRSFFARYMPIPGDYYVVYNRNTPDQYESFSPRKAFEEGYSLIKDKT